MPFLNTRKPAFHRSLSDGELVGSIAYFAGQSSAPDGWVLCDGSAVSRDTYAALFSAVGTTYGAGDGSTTFALPNLMDKFVEGSSTVGTVKSAGLPNIKGKVDSVYIMAYRTGYSGVFTYIGSAGKYGTNETTWNTGIDFDASRSNSIYGNSTTVQPPALTMKPFIYTGKTTLNKWKRTV